jgi:hypothetical protein
MIRGIAAEVRSEYRQIQLTQGQVVLTTVYIDTRYHFVTHDGANIFLHSEGSTTASGDIHARFLFETGSPAYYWLNQVTGKKPLTPLRRPQLTFSLAIGIGKLLGSYLHIDVWTVSCRRRDDSKGAYFLQLAGEQP